MLVLRQHQLAELAALRRNRFESRIVDHLARSYAGRLDHLPAALLPTFVGHVVKVSRDWGFFAECEIAELAMLLLEMHLASGSSSTPDWFSAIVGDPSLGAPAKLYQLIRRWHNELAALAFLAPSLAASSAG